MPVGIIGGTGPAGRALALRLAANGVEVVIGSRSAERGDQAVRELLGEHPGRDLPLHGGSNEEAARAEVVVLATPWEGALETALEYAAALEGKLLISMVAAITKVGRDFQALVPVRGSIAATLQGALPRARVAAAFQHLPARELGAIEEVLHSDVLVCADDPGAADETVALVDRMEGLRGVRAGSLASANAIEALTAVLINVNVAYRSHVALRLEGLRHPKASA